MSVEESFAPTSFSQRRLWFFDQLQPGSPLYSIQASTRLSGPLNITALHQAIDEIIRRHQVLRTVFRSVEGQPVQVILSPSSAPIPEIDFRGLTSDLRRSEIVRLSGEQIKLPFDLMRGPLLRVVLVKLDDAEQLLVLTVHHIVFDGWSVRIFFQELAVLYDSFRSGRGSPLLELPLQYADYARAQQERPHDKALDAELAYWREKLRGAPASVDLPTNRPRPPTQTFSGAIRPLVVPPTVAASLRDLSRAAGLTLFMTMLAAFGALLFRYTGQEAVVIGAPIANRGRLELQPLIGFLVNTLVLRLDVTGNPSFLQLAHRCRELAVEAYANQETPFERVVEELRPDRDPSRNPLFQIMFVFQDSDGPAEPTASRADLDFGELDSPPAGVARFDLTLTVTDVPPLMRGTLEYNTDLFDSSTIHRMADHFSTLLAGIAAAPDQRISELPLLTPAEQHRLLVEWNDTTRDFGKHQNVLDSFAEKVADRPHGAALVWQGREVTYAELDGRIARIAQILMSRSGAPSARIGVCMERSVDLVAALLGVMRAGRAAVPLDPAYPPSRLAFMIQDAELQTVLTQTSVRGRVPDTGAHAICIDELPETVESWPEDGAVSDDIAYVIYTSGSTGVPKGVLIEHSGFRNVIAAQVRDWGVGPDSRVLQFASLSFDAAMSEIFMALTAGACLCLAPTEELLPGPPLARTLQMQRITLVTLPPSALAALRLEPLPDLRTLVVAGEASDGALVASWANGRRLINAYGPTEATICATFGEFEPDTGRFPIGRPIANTKIYILDSHGNPVPIGVKGEIHIGGVGVARGYLNRADLTELRFLRSPFLDDPRARLYRTGDIGRYMTDGNIEFLGRIDQQVKIRGFRIEIGEIENTLRQHQQVQDAVVVAVPQGADRKLIAYVVGHDGPVLVHELRSFLQKRLPDYMLPAAFAVLADLPRTPNGKVDRQALPGLENLGAEAGLPYSAPQTEVERSIAGVWQEILALKRVGLNDNFFDLGGHSLLLVQVHDRLERLLKVKISLVDLFRYPTIESLAEFLGVVETASTRLDRAEERVSSQAEMRMKRRRRRRAGPHE
jgi:surfactin family lipopeptide synthetase A